MMMNSRTPTPRHEQMSGSGTNENQQQVAQRSRWQAVLLEAGGIGAAVSEESMRRLKYCLQWLQVRDKQSSQENPACSLADTLTARIVCHRAHRRANPRPEGLHRLAAEPPSRIAVVRRTVVAPVAAGRTPPADVDEHQARRRRDDPAGRRRRVQVRRRRAAGTRQGASQAVHLVSAPAMGSGRFGPESDRDRRWWCRFWGLSHVFEERDGEGKGKGVSAV